MLSKPKAKRRRKNKPIYKNGWCNKEIFKINQFNQEKHNTHIINACNLLKTKEKWVLFVPLYYLTPEQQQKLVAIILNDAAEYNTTHIRTVAHAKQLQHKQQTNDSKEDDEKKADEKQANNITKMYPCVKICAADFGNNVEIQSVILKLKIFDLDAKCIRNIRIKVNDQFYSFSSCIFWLISTNDEYFATVQNELIKRNFATNKILSSDCPYNYLSHEAKCLPIHIHHNDPHVKPYTSMIQLYDIIISNEGTILADIKPIDDIEHNEMPDTIVKLKCNGEYCDNESICWKPPDDCKSDVYCGKCLSSRRHEFGIPRNFSSPNVASPNGLYVGYSD
eukprot:200280_1